MGNRERAQVWQFFHKEGEKSVVCGLCGQRLTFCSSTSTMRYHLERKHPVQWSMSRNDKGVSADPLSASTVVISEDTSTSDPTFDLCEPLRVDKPKKSYGRKVAKKSVENNQSDTTSLVPFNSEVQMIQQQQGSSASCIRFNNNKNTNAITYYITDMLVRDLLPLRHLENQGFRQLLDYIEPTYSIPSRECVMQSLETLYNEAKPGVIQSLSQVDTLSITMDIWTSITSRIFLTLTAYWVTEGWTLTNRVLSTSSLEAGYTVEDLGTRVHETLNEYCIDIEKVTAIVHADTENWPSEICGIPAVTCFAFTLHEAVKRALELPPISRLVTASRKLVGNVKHLSGSIVEVPLVQKSQVAVSEIKLETDIPSRWFSTCTMLKLLHEQRHIINALVGDEVMERSSGGVFGENSEQWDILGEIVCILHPLKTATEVISVDKNVSVSSVFPILHGLTTVHLSDKLEDSDTAKLFKQVVRSEIDSRWSLDSIEVVQTVPVIASLLDPRYRDPLYLSVEQRGNVKDCLMKVVASCPSSDQKVSPEEENSMSVVPTTSSTSSNMNLSALEFLLGRHVMMDQQSHCNGGSDASEAEFKLYMDPIMNPPAATDTNPLQWWQSNRLRFPILARNAKRFLCVPATYAPTDKLFTSEGILFNSSRSQLEYECINYLLFLNSNIATRKM